MTRISLLPSLSLADRASLPHVPAIYFAHSHGKILYVGKANDLQLRWNSRRFGAHHKLNELAEYRDVRLSYWVRPLWRLNHDEAVMIQTYKPLLNERRESRVWWISLLDYCQNCVWIGCAIVFGLFVVSRLHF